MSEVSRLTVLVSPGARRSEIVGRHGDAWKARVAAPAEGGRANRALVQLLAEVLSLPRERISLVTGHKTKRKLVAVEGLEQEETERRLERAAG